MPWEEEKIRIGSDSRDLAKLHDKDIIMQTVHSVSNEQLTSRYEEKQKAFWRCHIDREDEIGTLRVTGINSVWQLSGRGGGDYGMINLNVHSNREFHREFLLLNQKHCVPAYVIQYERVSFQPTSTSVSLPSIKEHPMKVPANPHKSKLILWFFLLIDWVFVDGGARSMTQEREWSLFITGILFNKAIHW